MGRDSLDETQVPLQPLDDGLLHKTRRRALSKQLGPGPPLLVVACSSLTAKSCSSMPPNFSPASLVEVVPAKLPSPPACMRLAPAPSGEDRMLSSLQALRCSRPCPRLDPVPI